MIPKLVLVTLLPLIISLDALAEDFKPSTNREIAIQAMTDLFVYRDLTALDRYFGEPYIQHRTDLGDGLKELKDFFVNLLGTRPAFTTNIYRSIADRDMVMLHSVYEGSARANGKPLAAFDLFRFKNGRIVEHWDLLNVQGEPNLSGRSAVDGPASISDLHRTEANRAVVRNFTETVLVGGHVDRAGEFISANRYFEHALMGSDGLEAFKTKTKSNPRVSYKVHHILAEGNFVVVEAESGSGTQIIYDLYRLEGGKIVEHWDVQNTVPPRDQWKNNNGPF